MRFVICHAICLKYCACHEKVMPGHTKCCTCHTNHLSKPEDLMLQTPLRKSAPGPPNSLWWTCLLYCVCHAKSIFADPRQMSHACHRFWKCYKALTFCSLLTRCTIPCACPRESTSERSKKCSVPHSFLHFWLRKCASRHNCVHFFDISTSKSALNPRVFYTFDFEMCFAPQRRALFRHLNCQKCSGREVFFSFLTSKICFAPQRRAIFHSSSGQMAPHLPLWRACFSTLWSHKSLEKRSDSRLSYLFAHQHLLSSDSFSSLIFSLLLFAGSSHLCFFICPYCRKFDF